MGEYFREPGSLIQADFALHAGKLLAHYSKLTATLSSEAKYEATLGVCVLQSLLTNCIELLTQMQDHQRPLFDEPIPDVRPRWGLTRSFIARDDFPGDLTLKRTLTHMRHAVSHPTAVVGPQFPSTGYTTLPDGSGLISGFRFTDSPWVKNGKRWEPVMPSTERAMRAQISKFERDHDVTGYLEVLSQPDGSFEIAREGHVYWPLFVIELPLQALTDLAKHLANHLAQPTRERWDGRSIRHLVA